MRIWPKFHLTQMQSAISWNLINNNRIQWEKSFVLFHLRAQCECNEVNLPVTSNRNMISTRTNERTEKKKDGRPSHNGSISDFMPLVSEKYQF